ncbi:hypothetical protein FDP41_001950 [Naegleria fowleri]|uniref:40S ribosomal protein S25 n=1 Tax=Naegleria fowleri TaxID=5763 RepID=A0A6A5BZ83_NAEFO|nr:uncharacterized protein FDP41_001950 [Naegleria fowleri]KAF0978880.1 hypothetical protein FDP41_001950 [Naegleria fowleri]
MFHQYTTCFDGIHVFNKFFSTTSVDLLVIGFLKNLLQKKYNNMAGKSKEIQAQKAAARESGSKGKKKKWSKSRVKEKLNNKVLFDTKSFNQLVKEVPKMKLITIARVSEALGVTGSVAKKGLRYLEEKDLIKPVVKHSNMMVYVVKKEETAEAPKEETKPSKKESKKEKQ